MATDLGRIAIDRMLKLLGVEVPPPYEPTHRSWVLWGAIQHAWWEPAVTPYVDPIWTLLLRTLAVEGFSASRAQSVVLAAPFAPPTLACLVQSADSPDRLEMATNLEVHRENVEWVSRVLAVAARVQAAEARMFSELKGLGWVGLRPGADINASTPPGLLLEPSEVFLGGLGFEPVSKAWPETEVMECIGVLRLRTGADAVRPSPGMTATLILHSARRPQGILDINVRATHPLLGRGLSLTLTTSVVSGPLNAIVTNSIEVGSKAVGDALGGWSSQPGVLKYTGFYPDVFYRKGLLLRLLLEYARRA